MKNLKKCFYVSFKKKLILLLVFLLIWNPSVFALESGYICAVDLNNDGDLQENEYAQCQQVEKCPLGNFPCNDGICVDPNQTYFINQTSNINCQFMFDTRSGETVYFSGSGNCVSITVGDSSWEGCFEGVTFSGSLSFRGDSRCSSCVHYYPDRFCYNDSCVSVSGGIFETNILSSLIWAHPVYIQSDSKGIYIDAWGCGTSTYLKVKKQVSATCVPGWECPLSEDAECKNLVFEDSPGALNQFETTNTNFTYYPDNGDRNDDGSCAEQVLIFNGQPQECLRSGVQTGFHNCCSDCDGEIKDQLDNAFSELGTLIGVGQTLWQYTSIAWEAYQAWNYINLINNVGGTITVTNIGTSVLSFDASTGTISDALYNIVTNASTATDAIQNTLLAAFPSPQTILLNLALSFVIQQAMAIFFGGCDADSMLTACYKEFGLCHYIGNYCKEKWPLVGCVQRAEVYCCFNSKLARIIHEQGRPQLTTFGTWGTVDNPDCRGFTPEEFQMLDFSKIDLSEWYGDIQTRVQEDIQLKTQENIQKFQESVR